MPAVGQGPTEDFTLVVWIINRDATLVFELFVKFFDTEVNLVSELVEWNDAALFFVQAVRIDFDNDASHFCSIGLHLELKIRLIVDLLFADFTANRVSLCNDWHYFLQLGLNLTQLQLSLLLVELIAHLLLQIFLILDSFLLKLCFLLTHLLGEPFALLFHLPLSFLAI